MGWPSTNRDPDRLTALVMTGVDRPGAGDCLADGRQRG